MRTRRAGRSSSHQSLDFLRVGRAATDDAVGSKRKNIAPAVDRDCASFRREGPPFDCIIGLVENDVIDLVGSESRNFDGSVDQNQVFEFDLEFIEVPFAFLAQAVDGQPENPLLGFAQMLGSNARRPREP